QRAVVDEVLELALLELLRRAVPGGADEAVPLGVGEAETVAGLRRRDALQLQVTVTAPGRFAFVADLLADGDGVAAALQHQDLAHADAAGIGPQQRHFQAVLALGALIAFAAILGPDQRLVAGRGADAGPHAGHAR